MTLVNESIWAMEPQALERYGSLRRYLEGQDLSALEARAGTETTMRNGVAVIPVMGPLTKNPGLIEAILGFASTDEIREAVESAAADEMVREIVLRIDSPGGSVAGMAELDDAILSARERKTVTAQVDGQAASAGYSIASQATEIYAGRQDIVGSIGVRLMLYDMSQMFEAEGIEPVVIDTGEFKSAGAPGTGITQSQRNDFQRLVDSFFEEFRQVVMRGRGISSEEFDAVADGRVWVGQEAVDNGLIDRISTYRETMQNIMQRNSGQSPNSAARRLRAATI